MRFVSRLWNSFAPLQWVKADPSYIEAFSGLMAWAWGILLLLPFDTFSATPSYAAMKWLAPEWLWGTIFCCIGALHSLALCAGFNRLRPLVCMVAAFLWAFVGCTFVQTIPQGIAAWIWLGLAGMVSIAGARDVGK